MLDDLRAIDINDYAIGLGTSYSSGVYVDQESSSYLYPYVTKYTPMEFDESVLMMRAGGYGVRWLGDSGWEAGALARPQTLGFGSNASPSLDGLDDRGWTVEVGPTLGWRNDSIRVDWTVFADLLGHHDGTNQVLRLSRPFLFLKGYIVPELGLQPLRVGLRRLLLRSSADERRRCQPLCGHQRQRPVAGSSVGRPRRTALARDGQDRRRVARHRHYR